MAGKYIYTDATTTTTTPAGTLLSAQIEMSAPGFGKQCGVCHVGGGQMEYDYDMKEYGDPTSTDVASRYTYRVPRVEAGVVTAGGIVLTSSNPNNELYLSNKTEVDCMMCHMNGTATGAAWYKSTGCNGTTVPGPADDPACTGPRFTFTAGATYDSYNRNYAVSLGWFKQAASAGLGAILNPATGALSLGATTIPGAKIAYVPNSENCAACHARTNSDSIGLPMEAEKYGGMIAGYGNFFRVTAAGQAFDWDEIDGVTGNVAAGKDGKNDKFWNEFGCKTGMGKRAQRSGVGSQDRFGFGVCFGCAAFEAMMGDPTPNWFNGGVCGIPSVQAMCNAKAGATLQGTMSESMAIFENPATQLPKKIVGKMSDTDVHDAAGLKCGTCHNALSGDRPAKTISTPSGVSYTYTPLTGATSLQAIDHQMAQGYSMMEKADDINDGTVTCEGCHIDRTHPNTGAAPVPAHAGFPALHFEKIDCRTCHIPAVYSSPGRLLFRDWTAGAFRQVDGSNGNANHFDFAYNFSDGGAVPMQPLRTWITAGGHTKIVGVLPSMLPVWTGPAKNIPGTVLGWSPLKTRDITAAAARVAAANSVLGIRINGVSDYPMFQGFHLTDPLKFESKAKHDLLAAELTTGGAGLAIHATATAPRMNLFPLFFDVSHGITPVTNTLGASAAGGCVMCHSSSAINPMTGQPVDPATYSSKSVGFFDASKDMLKNGMMQMADYDCGEVGNTGQMMMMCGNFDAMGSIAGTCEAAEFAACKGYIGSNLYPQFGMPSDVANAMPVDGIDMMQLFAIREGAMALGCDTRYAFFGFPSAGRMTAQGSMTNGTGPTNGCEATDFYSRDEIRLMFKKNLQQSMIASATTGTWTNPVTGVSEQVPATLGRVFSIVSRAKNPSNTADAGNKFDMGATCITDPMTGATGPCTDGGYMNTKVTEQQLLGYSATQLAKLMSFDALGVSSGPTTTTLTAARFSYRIDSTNGLMVHFDASASIGSGYAWDFGDLTSGNTVTATHTYGTAGTKTVSLTVNGATKTVQFTLAANNNAPSAAATTVTQTGDIVTLADASSDPDGDVLSIKIGWGDGTYQSIASGSTVTHQYAAGSYTVMMHVADKKGGNMARMFGPYTVVNAFGTIAGTVADSLGNGIKGAVVTLYSNSTSTLRLNSAPTTSTSGAYAITNVPYGVYDARAMQDGYIFSSQTVTVTLAVPVDTADFMALPTFKISGAIANAPDGILIKLTNGAPGVVQQTVTYGGTGKYTFFNIGFGTYTVDPQPTVGSTIPSLVSGVSVTTMDVIVSSMTFTNP